MKNSLRRIFALALVVMMIASLGMSAAAAETIEFSKKLTKESKVYAPKTTYEFTITAGAKAEGDTQTVYEGPLAAIKFVATEDNQTADDDKLTITSTPDENDLTVEELLYTSSIEIDGTQFNNPGIYRYVITETDGEYEGVTYDAAHTLDVFVAYNDEGELYIYGCEIRDEDGTKTDSDDGNFVNDYDTADLTVTNDVTGNMGDTNKIFKYTVEITGVAGEQYLVELADGTTETIVAGTDGKASLTEIELKDTDDFKVYGLSAGDSYTVTQENYAADGYTTTNNSEEGEGLVGSGAIQAITGEMTEVADDNVTFTNNNETTPPTGIAMTVLPFVAMIALAAIVAVLFFQKRERREA